MNGAVTISTARGHQAVIRARPRPRFYAGLCGLLLLIVLTGFARTFYLRALLDVPQVPIYVLVHGAVLTVWFTGLLLQAVLVSVGRTSTHRRFGWVVAGVGLAVVAITGPVILNLAPRQRALGADIDARVVSLVWLDLSILVAFAVFLAAGVLMRHRPEWHKRLMLLASVTIASPALGRAWNLAPMLRGLNSTLTTLGLAAFLAGLAAHDFASDKRIHPATLTAGLLLMALRTVAPLIAASEFGRSFVQALG